MRLWGIAVGITFGDTTAVADVTAAPTSYTTSSDPDDLQQGSIYAATGVAGAAGAPTSVEAGAG